MSVLARQLASELRALLASPVTSEADLPGWTGKANLIRKHLATSYRSLEPFVTEELEHYMSDPDIRLKDAGYREMQTKIILALISDLESGKIDEIAAKIRVIGNSGSLWRSGVLSATYGVFIGFTILLLVPFLYGYGSWLYYLIVPATVILVLAGLGAACAYGRIIKYNLSAKDVLIILGLCVLVSFISYHVGWYARLLLRHPLLNSADRIVAVLDRYKKDHGSYPADSQHLPSLSLPEGVHLYKGVISQGEVRWGPYELGESDITVLVSQKEYEVYVPVEKISPITFSSFAVYRYASGDPTWILGRVHWNIMQAYWSEN